MGRRPPIAVERGEYGRRHRGTALQRARMRPRTPRAADDPDRPLDVPRPSGFERIDLGPSPVARRGTRTARVRRDTRTGVRLVESGTGDSGPSSGTDRGGPFRECGIPRAGGLAGRGPQDCSGSLIARVACSAHLPACAARGRHRIAAQAAAGCRGGTVMGASFRTGSPAPHPRSPGRRAAAAGISFAS